MKAIATRGAAQPPHMEKRVYDKYTPPKNIKLPAITPQFCDFCGRRITDHDRQAMITMPEEENA